MASLLPTASLASLAPLAPLAVVTGLKAILNRTVLRGARLVGTRFFKADLSRADLGKRTSGPPRWSTLTLRAPISLALAFTAYPRGV